MVERILKYSTLFSFIFAGLKFHTLVTTHYKEPGQDGQFDDCTKDVLEELCEDDYSDAEEELEANRDTD